MEQNNENNKGQITQSGDIYVCKGASTCPLNKGKESALQSQFYRDTGIWAPLEAREALERLMSEGGFTAPRLKAAWQASNLVWDDAAQKLVVKTHWLEPVAGWTGVVLMLLYVFLQGGVIIFSKTPLPMQGLAALLTALILYFGMAWFIGRHLLMPYGVGKRVRLVLAKMG